MYQGLFDSMIDREAPVLVHLQLDGGRRKKR